MRVSVSGRESGSTSMLAQAVAAASASPASETPPNSGKHQHHGGVDRHDRQHRADGHGRNRQQAAHQQDRAHAPDHPRELRRQFGREFVCGSRQPAFLAQQPFGRQQQRQKDQHVGVVPQRVFAALLHHAAAFAERVHQRLHGVRRDHTLPPVPLARVFKHRAAGPHVASFLIGRRDAVTRNEVSTRSRATASVRTTSSAGAGLPLRRQHRS